MRPSNSLIRRASASVKMALHR